MQQQLATQNTLLLPHPPHSFSLVLRDFFLFLWMMDWLKNCYPPRERAPGTHWIGGWVDPRACQDDVEKRKFLTLPGLEL
jgi:hypothetical protein